MPMKILKPLLSLAFLTAMAASQAGATVIVTYAEKPGMETSTLINTNTYNFDNLALGLNTKVDWTGVGEFNQLYIKSADQYGGAANTKYSVQGVNTSVSSTVLNLNTPSAYFGLWWSAGDASNVLDFYSEADGKGTLVAEFTTASLLKALGKTYYGNPNVGDNLGKDAGEPFAFINFFAVEGTTWSSVVFRNSSSSGFESDNYTSRVEAYNQATDGNMPGVVLEAITGTQVVALVPEPNASMAMALFGGLSVAGTVARGLKKRKA